MTLGYKIRTRRKELGLTLEEVGNAVGVGKSTVRKWETGDIRNMRRDKIAVLAQTLGFEPVELIDTPATSLMNRPLSGYVRIPVAGSVQAGIPTEAIEDVVDWEEISSVLAQRGDYVGLKVKGASMEPRFIEGDTVIVRRQPDVESGEIAIVFVNGDEATMKKVIKSPEGIMLVATNAAVYEPHFYSNRQIDELPVTIYGKVVELRGKL